MAVFDPGSAGNLSGLTDMKKVQDYLYRLQEQLQYMFRNLTPEDNNAASTPSLSYATNQTIKVIVNGEELDLVLADEVIKAINDSVETAIIQSNRVSWNGAQSAGGKFQISSLGVPSITDGNITNSTITGGDVTGADISGGTIDSTDITGGTVSGTDIQDGDLGPFELASTGISNTDMTLNADGTAELAELTLADSFWNGQTVTQVVQALWNAVFPT